MHVNVLIRRPQRVHYTLFCLVPRRGNISKMAGLLKARTLNLKLESV